VIIIISIAVTSATCSVLTNHSLLPAMLDTSLHTYGIYSATALQTRHCPPDSSHNHQLLVHTHFHSQICMDACGCSHPITMYFVVKSHTPNFRDYFFLFSLHVLHWKPRHYSSDLPLGHIKLVLVSRPCRGDRGYLLFTTILYTMVSMWP
jgi:hypothetical protein